LSEARTTIRIDKWLWFARFFKTRGLSAKLVNGGHLRVNAVRVAKASYSVGVGDVLTFPQADSVRVIEIADLGERRGPAPEAQTLYKDLLPVVPKEKVFWPANPESKRIGRPNRKDRDAMERFQDNADAD
jgi:ribosome-associated heat shock protein Hsp15